MPISDLAEIKDSTLRVDDDLELEAGVKLTGVFIKAKKLIIKSNSVLTDCKLFSDGVIRIGNDTTIKEDTIINAFRSISIGNKTIIDRDVFIGGMQSEKSQIVVGNNSVILYRSYLNTTRKISIGNNVGIGGYCLIFTHSAWQNVLEGNPYKFAEVKIKDNVWLPWRVTILPGVTIGRDVTIGSGSVVTTNIPPLVFAAGVPAKINHRKEIKNLSIKRKNSIILEILSDFHGYALNYLNIENTITNKSFNCVINLKNTRLIYTTNFKNIQKNDVVLSLRIPTEIKSKYDWIELDSLKSHTNKDISNHFLSFIRRYGMRIRSI